jgi:hypothetical protein
MAEIDKVIGEAVGKLAGAGVSEFANLGKEAIAVLEPAQQALANEVREQLGINSLPLDNLEEEPNLYGPVTDYDIIKDYNWTNSSIIEKNKIPSMVLTEYQMDGNMLLSNIKYWVKQLAKDKDEATRNNPYANLYKAKPTGVSYTFPWFNEYHHQLTQSWGEFKGIDSTKYGEMFVKIATLAADSPGVAINTPKEWKGPSPATITYEIVLFNTGNPQEIPYNISKNKQLINRLIMSTLHDQVNAIMALPPALFTLNIENIRYSPACVISSLDVTNIGVLIKDGGEIVPEAYKVKFAITELITESRQLFDAAVAGKKVFTAITND